MLAYNAPAMVAHVILAARMFFPSPSEAGIGHIRNLPFHASFHPLPPLNPEAEVGLRPDSKEELGLLWSAEPALAPTSLLKATTWVLLQQERGMQNLVARLPARKCCALLSKYSFTRKDVLCRKEGRPWREHLLVSTCGSLCCQLVRRSRGKTLRRLSNVLCSASLSLPPQFR